MSDRLIVTDAGDGDTILAMERHINSALHRYPEKKLLFFLDNFHVLGDTSGQEETGIAQACERIKKLTTKYNIPIFMNAELRKTEWKGKASIRDLKGSGAIEFRGDMVMMLHQAYHTDKDTKLVWDPGGEKAMQPIDELEIVKNKVSGYKGSIYLKFLTSRSRLDEMAPSAVEPLLDLEKRRVSELMKKRMDYDKRKTNSNEDGAYSPGAITEGPRT
jgi:hypothetical protein